MSAMRFVSTRNPGELASFDEALSRGLAPDGGLYVPQEWPRLALGELEEAAPAGLASLATVMLRPFVAGTRLEPHLADITAEAFSFEAPLVPLAADGSLAVLELFHGPTAAFKDFGARFLAASFARLEGARGGDGPAAHESPARLEGAAAAQGAGTARGATKQRTLTILVATSGDTGGAVAAAFHGRPGIEVAVLYPKGLVSPTQERQLTCWGGNVRSFAVRGTFDDCQRLVKEAFLDAELASRRRLTSANSINLGRLLPQAVYFAAASLAISRQHGEPASFVVPAGNLGNSLACIWARKLGLPIARVVLAHNANRTVPDFLRTSEWRPRPSIATLACAMDVGNPSNMERLRALYPDFAALGAAVEADSVDDEGIRRRIRLDSEEHGRAWCPHTATAAEVYARLPPERRRRGRWVIVATAHPAKFRELIEPLTGHPLDVPDTLARLLARPVSATEIAPQLDALRAALE